MTTITIQLTPEDDAALDEVVEFMAGISAETDSPPFTREEVAQTAVRVWLEEQQRIARRTPPAGVLTHPDHTPWTV